MTIGSILLGVALVMLVGLFVARPFIERRGQTGATGQRAGLLAQKEELLDKVRELDFDHETGKIPAEEQQRQRLLLMNQAAAILRQLDQGASPQSSLISTSAQTIVDAEIEAAVARLRRPVVRPAHDNNQGDVLNFCPQCGQRAAVTDRFCAYCGYALRRPQPV